jgi:hypothetical protein
MSRPAIPFLVRCFSLLWLPLLQRALPSMAWAHTEVGPWHLPLITAAHALLAHVPGGLRTPPSLVLLERICYPAAVQSCLLQLLGWWGVPHLWGAAAHASACYAWTVHWVLAHEPGVAQNAEAAWIRVCLLLSVFVTVPSLTLLLRCVPLLPLSPDANLFALAFAELCGALL